MFKKEIENSILKIYCGSDESVVTQTEFDCLRYEDSTTYSESVSCPNSIELDKWQPALKSEIIKLEEETNAETDNY